MELVRAPGRAEKNTMIVSASNAHKSITNDIIKNAGELCLYYSFSRVRHTAIASGLQTKWTFLSLSFSQFAFHLNLSVAQLCGNNMLSFLGNSIQ